MEEHELVRRLKNGEDAAFRHLVESYRALVLNCAYKFLRDVKAAEDVSQEVFLTLYESIGSFRMQSKLSTWLYRITISKALNAVNREKRRKRFAEIVRIFSGSKMEQKAALPKEELPEAALENAERARVLFDAVATLPENQRIAFTLSKYQGITYQKIAEIMGTSVSAVESLLFRANAGLRKKLFAYYKSNLE